MCVSIPFVVACEEVFRQNVQHLQHFSFWIGSEKLLTPPNGRQQSVVCKGVGITALNMMVTTWLCSRLSGWSNYHAAISVKNLSDAYEVLRSVV